MHICYTRKTPLADALAEIKSQAGKIKPELVIFFASISYSPEELSAGLAGLFPGTAVFGCTSSGEIAHGRLQQNSIAAAVFDRKTVTAVSLQVVQNLSSGPDLTPALTSLSGSLSVPLRNPELSRYAGLVLIDGLCGCEEAVMEQIGAKTDIHFIGGSAGDDLQFKKTYIFSEGKTYTDAAVLALIQCTNKFEILKTQSFIPSEKILHATKVNEKTREVVEFNGYPAREAYARALGVEPADADKYFMSNPLGLMIAGEPYVRSPQQFIGSNMKFYCRINEGMRLNILQSRDISGDTQKSLAEKIHACGKPRGILNFHCILRTLELQNKKQTGEYAEVFKGIPTLGFSTYGEQYIGHINQTSTMLLIY